jgi:hypothetical protein
VSFTETRCCFGVVITRADGTSGMASHSPSPMALFLRRPDAVKFAKELRPHLKSCKVRVEKLTVTVTKEAP